jgi:hypothetical protein
MRKLALILAVLMAVSGVAFASDVTVSGVVDHSWGFGADGYYPGRSRAETNVDAQVDEINSLGVTIRYGDIRNDSLVTDDGTGYNVTILNAHFSTDLGAALALDGMTLVTKVGWYEATNFNVGLVTGPKVEEIKHAQRTQNIQLDYAFGEVVKFRGVIAPGEGDAMDGLIAVAGGAGPVMVEVAFSDFGGRASADGQVTAGVLFADAVVPDTVDLSVGATFYYDLAAEESSWGAGAKAGLLGGLSTVGVAFNGNENDAVSQLGFDLNVAPVDFAGLDLFVGLDIAGNDAFGYFETSAYLKPGAATFRLGYAMTGPGTAVKRDQNAADAVPADGAEEGAIFFRTTLSY